MNSGNRIADATAGFARMESHVDSCSKALAAGYPMIAYQEAPSGGSRSPVTSAVLAALTAAGVSNVVPARPLRSEEPGFGVRLCLLAYHIEVD